MLPHSNELWTVDETAAYLKLKPKTIYDYVSARAIPVIRIGRSVRFSRETIQEWVLSKQERELGRGTLAKRGKRILDAGANSICSAQPVAPISKGDHV